MMGGGGQDSSPGVGTPETAGAAAECGAKNRENILQSVCLLFVGCAEASYRPSGSVTQCYLQS